MMMRSLIVALALAVGMAGASAQEVLMELSWEDLNADGRIQNGQVVPPDEDSPVARLKVSNTDAEPLRTEVVTIEEPAVKARRYAITGEVRHEGVKGRGFLEMWSYFPGGAAYFSRTLAEEGPMQDLEGSSDWRPFSLPFFMNEGMRPPQKLVVNVVLPGAGTVFLKPLRLVQYEGDLHTAWWGQRTGGLIGGIAGGLLGCIGSLCGILVRLGRGRRFVVGVLSALIPLGALGVVFGIAAASLSQPFPVWFPLVLPGALCFTLSLGTLPKARQRYGQMELRRMEAMDAR